MHQNIIEKGDRLTENGFGEIDQGECPERVFGIVFSGIFDVIHFCEPAAVQTAFQKSVPVCDPVSDIVLNGEDAALDADGSVLEIGKVDA